MFSSLSLTASSSSSPERSSLSTPGHCHHHRVPSSQFSSSLGPTVYLRFCFMYLPILPHFTSPIIPASGSDSLFLTSPLQPTSPSGTFLESRLNLYWSRISHQSPFRTLLDLPVPSSWAPPPLLPAHLNSGACVSSSSATSCLFKSQLSSHFL